MQGGRSGRPHATILSLQHDLFVAGAELATSPEAADRLQDGVSRITDGMVEALEADIDRYMNQVDLPPHFVIPGGTELSAALDVARTAIRRAERRVVELRDAEGLASDAVLRYLNRASDLAFALARFADEPEPADLRGQERDLMRACRRPPAPGLRARGRDPRAPSDRRRAGGEGRHRPGPACRPSCSPPRWRACTAITMEMYADRKEWGLGTVEVAVDYTEATTDDPPDVRRHGSPSEPSSARRTRDRLRIIAGKCPVHRALKSQDVVIHDSLELVEDVEDED